MNWLNGFIISCALGQLRINIWCVSLPFHYFLSLALSSLFRLFFSHRRRLSPYTHLIFLIFHEKCKRFLTCSSIQRYVFHRVDAIFTCPTFLLRCSSLLCTVLLRNEWNVVEQCTCNTCSKQLKWRVNTNFSTLKVSKREKKAREVGG